MRSSQQALLQALPGDWGTAPLAEIASIHSGSTPKREVAAYWGGDIPWVTPGELTGLGSKYLTDTAERITAAGLASCSATRVPPNALLVTTRATLGSAALAAMHVATNQGFRSLVFSDGADPNFYYHLAPLLVSELTRRASGTTFLEISGREFGSVGVPLPPLSEQRRIAEILDTLDEAIRGTEQVIAKLQQMKQGLLHDLLTRGIDENGELRDPARHPGQFKDSPRSLIPCTWAVTPVGGLCQLLNGLAFKPEDWTDAGLPIIRIQNLNGSQEFNRSARAVPSRYVIAPGTLLFSWSGNRGTSFGPFIWNGPEGILNQHIFRVTPNPSTYAPWLFFALDLVRQHAERSAHGGSGLVHIRRGDMLNFSLATPPSDEQRRIATAIESAESRVGCEAATLAKLRTLKTGLMDDLLTGRVRVPIAEEAAP